jgi:hypothetical protein
MRRLALVVGLGFGAACGGGSVGGTTHDDAPDAGACVADLVAPGGACPAQCTSCDGDTCKIDCGPSGCNDTTITCPADFNCEITCSGGDACDTTIVNCPDKYACSMKCTAYDSCGDVIQHCGLGTCTMECNGPTEACGGSTLDCAPGGPCGTTCNSGSHGPSVDCRGACSCTPC